MEGIKVLSLAGGHSVLGSDNVRLFIDVGLESAILHLHCTSDLFVELIVTPSIHLRLVELLALHVCVFLAVYLRLESTLCQFLLGLQLLKFGCLLLLDSMVGKVLEELIVLHPRRCPILSGAINFFLYKVNGNNLFAA